MQSKILLWQISLSVRHSGIETNAHTIKLFTFRWGRDSLDFCEHYRRYKIPRDTRTVWALNTWGGKNLRFSTEIAVYLGNGTREVHGYYESLGHHR